MANEYFTPSGYPATGAAGSSASMRSELALVEDGFDKLPTLTGNGGKIVAVNSGGTGLTTSATLSESGGTVTVTGNLSVTGDTTLGNASGDALTIASSAVTWSGNPTHSGNHTFSGGLTLTSPLPTSSGGTGLSSFTANRVFYASSTSAIGSSANLTFDGSTLATSAFTATGNVNLNGGTFTFNDAGADLDARFEGDTDANLLFLDASTDRVGIGTNSPGTKLDIQAPIVDVRLLSTTGTNYVRQRVTNTGGDFYYGIDTSTGSNFGAAYAAALYYTGNYPMLFATNSAERMRITSSGDVGIGTSSPASRLDVSGSVNAVQARFGNVAGRGLEIGTSIISGTNDAGSVLNAKGATSGTLIFQTDSTERMRLDASGNLGIGTNSPTERLTVSSSAVNTYMTVRNSGSSVLVLTSGTGFDAGGAGAVYTTTAVPLSFGTNSTERMRITSSGDVGIGVTPSAWSVLKALQFPVGAVASFDGGAGNRQINLFNNAYYDGLSFRYVASDTALAYRILSGEHQWFNAPSGTAGNTISFTQAMTLDGSGNLLVGTTSGYRSGRLVVKDVNRTQASTTANLHVSTTDSQAADLGGSIGLGGQVGGDEAPFAVISGRKENSTSGNYAGYLAFATQNSSPATAERMRITSSGDVGIGTSSPAQILDIIKAQNAGTVAVVRNGNTGANASAQFVVNADTATGRFAAYSSGAGALANHISIEQTTNNPITFYTNSSERVRITGAGDVGIGTNIPAAKLHVVGSQAIVQATSGAVSIWKDGTPSKAARMAFNTTTGDGLEFGLYDGSSWSAPVVISSSGYVFINTLTTSHGGNPKLVVNGGSGQGLEVRGDAAGSWPFLCGNTATSGDNSFIFFGTEAGGTTQRGSIDYNRAGGLVRYNTTSDYRAKDIIGPVQNPGAAIDALKVYEGKMKGATQSRPMLVAHEAQAVAPYAVSGVKDEVNEDGSPKFQQIDASSLVPLLLAEIQSLRARVAALEAQ